MTLLAPTADFSRGRSSTRLERLEFLHPWRVSMPSGLRARQTETGLAWVGLFTILAAIIAARAFGVIPISECHATPSRLAFDPITEVKMTTSARAPCLLALELGTARVDTLTITAQPEHGVVAPRGRTGVVYRPVSGFRGQD